MNNFLNDFANSMVEINQTIVGHLNNNNQYAPGIGPYGEDQIVDVVMNNLSANFPGIYQTYYIRPGKDVKAALGLSNYVGISNRAATPDLILGNKIMEFKIARPLRDNGVREDTWFKKVFEPNPNSYSTFIDVEKLCRFSENFDQEQRFEKWVVIIGFERLDEVEYRLDELFPGLFKYISENISKRIIKNFVSVSAILGNQHSFHQVVKLFAFQY